MKIDTINNLKTSNKNPPNYKHFPPIYIITYHFALTNTTQSSRQRKWWVVALY